MDSFAISVMSSAKLALLRLIIVNLVILFMDLS